MIKFSIFLLTYNRHELVVKTLNSLIAQTYTNFEVLLYDNGSSPSVKYIIDAYQDNRIIYKRYEKNQNSNDVAEDSLNNMSGSHFIFLADDDVLVPNALNIVNDLFCSQEIDILQVGVVNFNHTTLICDLSKINLHQFTGKLDISDSVEAAFHFCNVWGIGPIKNYKGPRTCHPSGFFISREMIKKTRQSQAELFLKPFGDVGYVGALLNTDKYHYLDLPLAIIGEAQIRETNGDKPGQRHKWNKDVEFLEHSPLKGVSFTNMATDVHLKALHRNNWHEKYDCRLRPDFYFRHLKQVLSDSPWTYITLRDALEVIPYAFRSVLNFITLSSVANLFYRILKKPYVLVRGVWVGIKIMFGPNRQVEAPKIMSFKDINNFAIWIERNYVDVLIESNRVN